LGIMGSPDHGSADSETAAPPLSVCQAAPISRPSPLRKRTASYPRSEWRSNEDDVDNGAKKRAVLILQKLYVGGDAAGYVVCCCRVLPVDHVRSHCSGAARCCSRGAKRKASGGDVFELPAPCLDHSRCDQRPCEAHPGEHEKDRRDTFGVDHEAHECGGDR